jgi:hypothetical protein
MRNMNPTKVFAVFADPNCAHGACTCGARVPEEHVSFLYFGHYVCTECQIHLFEHEAYNHVNEHNYPCIEFHAVDVNSVPSEIRNAAW